MNTFKYIFLLLFIIACKNENKTGTNDLDTTSKQEVKEELARSKNFQLLQGSWQNTLDTLSVIKIEGAIIKNFYNGTSTNTGVKITLGDRCIDKPDPSKASEPDRYISITGTYNDCYYITKLDENNLSLNFLNAGFDLNFKHL